MTSCGCGYNGGPGCTCVSQTITIIPPASIPIIIGTGQGSQGVQGAHGIQGSQGLQGLQGFGYAQLQGTQGVQGSQGLLGAQGVQGIQGVQGTQGVQGVQGTQGNTGIQGYLGNTGAAGATGSQGTQGVQGSQGLLGAQGYLGNAGAQGAQGTQGLQGTSGAQGTAGAQGYLGNAGAQGAQGTQGLQGIQGLQGTSGAQGYLGNTGSQGAQGTQGLQGSQGALGSQGYLGNPGTDGAQGAQGTQGLQGVQGVQGAIGAGTQGIQGPQSSQGTQGVQGLQGIQGIQGFLGNTGSQGLQGTQGLQGVQGPQSSQGTTGVQGFQGVQGLQGLQGNIGVQGIVFGSVAPTNTGVLWANTTLSSSSIQGTQGVQGGGFNQSQGVQGIQGIQGTQGTLGLQGFTGTQGTQGTQGLQGTQGIQGAQGIQGVQGLQGLQGTQPTVSMQTWRYTATGGETTLSGTDGFSTTLAYTVGAEQVFINGVLLVRGTDYTASTGTSITGLTALVAGDSAEVVSPSSFTVANAIPLATIAAKGDLVVGTASGTVTNLGVGADGSTLVANSSASTGVSWAGPIFTAGKNKVINGDFGIWQRGTSFSGIGNLTYTADRWFTETGGTANVTQQTFTAGSAPVSGYEGTYYLQYATATTNSAHGIDQKIEDVRAFAGQTVTISAWMKATAATTMTVIASQSFGSGGSTQVDAGSTTWTLGTSWQRYTFTVAIPSISGKTIGTGSALNIRFLNLTNASFTFQLWGVQIEAGSIATPFTTATGTLQGELAACQRYYWRQTAPSGYAALTNKWSANATNQVYFTLTTPVAMRASNSVVDWGGNLALTDGVTGNSGISSITASGGVGYAQTVNVSMSSAVLTQYRPYHFGDNGAGTAYIGVGCEL